MGIGDNVGATNEFTHNSQASNSIFVRGARTNNLKRIDVEIPHNRLTVIAGPSGSGKSSLAIDTIYAEAQRQYVESLSFSSRQWLQPLPPPPSDEISGLPPAISIDQHKGSANPRSTVGTLTEIHDYLRVLMARVGQPYCKTCDKPIHQSSITEIVDELCKLPERTKVMVLAPCQIDASNKLRDVVNGIRKAGQVRVHIAGKVVDIDDFDEYSADVSLIDAVVDRVMIKDGVERRLMESFGVAEKLSAEFDTGGSLAVSFQRPGDSQNDWVIERFSTMFKCSTCDFSLAEIEPRCFSFNSPYGSCQVCDGLGTVENFDTELFVFDWSLSIGEGAIRPWQKLSKKQLEQRIDQVQPLLASLNISETQSLAKLSSEQRENFLGSQPGSPSSLFETITKEWVTCTDKKRLAELNQYRNSRPCQTCNGNRLGPLSENVKLGTQTINDINNNDLSHCLEFFQSLDLPQRSTAIATPLINEINNRLSFLNSIGLGYLSLGRSADSLSGGEYQRVRLATAAGTALTGVCYVLDEPSIGLHPSDSMKLIASMKQLRDQQNTVVVVEHDALVKRHADWLIEIGPGAGPDGGQLVFSGPVKDCENEILVEHRESNPHAMNRTPRSIDWNRSIEITGARGHNLDNIDVQVPLNCLVCVSGVSGSGKSTLINQTLVPALKRKLGLLSGKPLPFNTLNDRDTVQQVITIDQTPIGRSPRSNAATFTGMFDLIRKLFASTKTAKQLGFTASRFTFNSKSGACPNCQGFGAIKISMAMMPDSWIPCEICHGKRFNEQTLQVKYGDKDIADILALSVAEAAVFFQNVDKVHRVLDCLVQIGLGYLSLGQPSNTLSGGEAQRINLAVALAKSATHHTLYVLDEPTTGLHADNVKQLLSVLNQLIDSGNSVIVIEHNLDLLASSDWIVDMGPGGGPDGGKVVCAGTPASVAGEPSSLTGKFLQTTRR